jgi:hypothetical protein
MDYDVEKADQIAHVFIDFLSIASDDSLDDEEGAMLRSIETAQARVFELGGITVSVSDSGGLEVDPTPLIGGAVNAIGALFRVARRAGGFEDDALIAAWREEIDAP